jgi:hypothetical protein
VEARRYTCDAGKEPPSISALQLVEAEDIEKDEPFKAL